MILVITGVKRSLVVRAKHTKLVGKYQTANFSVIMYCQAKM